MGIFIIAELGINHNGDVEIAKKLIDVAKDCGCDAVKFQKRTIELVYSKEELDQLRVSPWGTTNREQKHGLEFNEAEYKIINNYCNKKNIPWFASAWDVESQKFLKQFNLKYNKIASAMLIDKILLEKVAAEKKYCFISTGMSTLNEIDEAVEIFKKNKCPFELMHCISTYPMEDSEANLNCIKTLHDRYKCKIGYSGHEKGLVISCAAAALGISSLERHITLDRTMYGTDQSASIEPNGLRQLVESSRKVNLALGDGAKKVLNSEIAIIKKLRKHIKK